jgi:hypothetical protein
LEKNNMKKTSLFAAAGLALGLCALTGPAMAGNENGNKFQCFSETTPEGGPCPTPGATSVTLDNAPGEYSGVYLQNSNLLGKSVKSINQLSFRYDGTISGGSPRITFPIDVNNDGGWDDFISADAVGCSDTGGTSGLVDVMNDPTCLVSFNGGPSYPNWAAFVAANPTARVATDAIPFIIADQPGVVTISEIQIGKGPARAAG